MDMNGQSSITEKMNLFPFAFEKMSGAGNDFIIIDHRRKNLPVAEQPEFARRVCRRKFSVGADGLILLEEAENSDFQWQFYNADGSVAEMCGNGARCAARFAFRHGMAGRKMRFQTLAGIIEAEVLKDEETVSLRMTAPVNCQLERTLILGGREMAVAFINTGVPHAVIFVDEKDIPVKEWKRGTLPPDVQTCRYQCQFCSPTGKRRAPRSHLRKRSGGRNHGLWHW